MQINEEWACPDDFRNWHFVELNIGKHRHVCSIVHCDTPLGIVPYWYDDHDHPQRALPLLKSMEPVDLGDYGMILQRGENMAIFVALCKILDDLPDPLIAVQCIQWISERKSLREHPDKVRTTRSALHGIQVHLTSKRREFDQLMQRLCGIPSAS